jgi:signal transduction histidine kinase
MALRRRDLAALLLAAITAFAGLAAWAFSTVDLGLVLGTDDAGRVRVFYVAPESIAAQSGFTEGDLVTSLQSIDPEEVLSTEPVDVPAELGGGEMLLPTEALPEWRIGFVETGWVDDFGQVYPEGMSNLYRPDWELRLSNGGWLLFLGAGLGTSAAFLAGRRRFGESWEAEGITLGSAIAIPVMATPLLYTGMPFGVAAAFLLPAAGMLPLARSLADRLSMDRWPAVLFAAATVVALTVALTTLRALSTFDAFSEDPADRTLLLAAITLVPALAAAFGTDRTARARTELVVIGLGPAAAVTLLGSVHPNPALLVAWLVAAIGWRPATDAFMRIRETRGGREMPPPSANRTRPEPEPIDIAAWRVMGLRLRDMVAIGIALATALGVLLPNGNSSTLAIGGGLGGLVGLAIHRGFLGPAWRDAAIPLACAVAIPIMTVSLAWEGASLGAAPMVSAALGALPVAHLLAQRHPGDQWRGILFLLSVGLAVVAISAVVILGWDEGWYAAGQAERYLLMGTIALLPGLVVAFSAATVGGGRVTDRLDTLVVALTPGAAMTVMVPSFGGVLLGAWLIGVIVLRRLTITPLLGVAQRTQRQRDLAVAAVEAERARLAADLHDDALQELSALVRRLDAAGDAEGADLARGVAERLRTITSDLRLPVLDDLGAGPALEWLVGRVRPLADGPVVLERVDPDRPPAGVELAVFRVAQEALANAVKHGKPPITVRYRVAEDGGVSLSVDDSGPGIETGAAEEALQAGHLGMANMQQRAEQIGALLDIRRWPAGGTHVALEWRPQ